MLYCQTYKYYYTILTQQLQWCYWLKISNKLYKYLKKKKFYSSLQV